MTQAQPPFVVLSFPRWSVYLLMCLLASFLAACGSAPPPKPAEPEPTIPWQRAAQRQLDVVLAQGLAERAPIGLRDATQAQALVIKPSTDESMRREGAGGPGLASFLAQLVDKRHPRYARAETGTVDAGLGRWELRTQITALDAATGYGASAYIVALELFDLFVRASWLQAASVLSTPASTLCERQNPHRNPASAVPFSARG